MSEIQVRAAADGELVEGSALLARALDFDDRDALPPWLVATAAGCDAGVALAAFEQERLVGFSFALRCAGDELFSCGLAVAAPWRDRGIGRRLKLAQREWALERGCTRIRWTADPLAAPALALYLGALGARLVGYEPELYGALRPAPVPPDDVLIEWPLAAPAAPAGSAGEAVEIPFRRRALDLPELRRWRLYVRRAMTAALARGLVGTGVRVDRERGRAWVEFSEPAR